MAFYKFQQGLKRRWNCRSEEHIVSFDSETYNIFSVS